MWRSTSKVSTQQQRSSAYRGFKNSDQSRKFYFNPKDDYEGFLEKLKQDFNIKYNSDRPSPETNLEGFQELTVLGSGSFGKVKLTKHVGTNRYYAVKTMLKNAIVRMKKVHHILSEKRVLQAIWFPTLVHLEFSTKDNDYLYLGLPVVSGGELYTYHRKVKKFNEKQARFYAMQIALGFEYLHHMKVIYRDLKLENILIDINGYIKLTDFSFAKKIESHTFTLCGTPEYLPPEIIKSLPYNASADWWCFGVFLFEMVAGRTPFFEKGVDMMVMYSRICDCVYNMPSYFTEAFKDIVDSFLQVDVTRRLGCQLAGSKDIKQHEWFHGTDWISILNQEVNAPYVPPVANLEDTSNFHMEHSRPGMKSEVNRHTEIFGDF